jgi:ribosomal protein L7/L12
MLPSQRINQKLDLILQKFEVLPGNQSNEETPLVRQVRALVASGKMIDAIKLYREATGAGLAEAKAAVEASAFGMPISGSPDNDLLQIEQKVDLLLKRLEIAYEQPDDNAFYSQVEALVRTRNKIEAIKIYREYTGTGLKEAKDAVDAIEKELKRR